MKKNIWLMGIRGVFCVALLVIVLGIGWKGITTRAENEGEMGPWKVIPGSSVTEVTVTDVNKSTENLTELALGDKGDLEEMLTREDFGEFYEVEVAKSYVDSKISEGNYYFTNAQTAYEILDILRGYEYYSGPEEKDLITETSSLSLEVRLRGNHDNEFVIRFFHDSMKPNKVVVMFSGESIAAGMDEEMAKRWLDTLYYTEPEACEKIINCLEGSIGGMMALQQAEEKIASAEKVLHSGEFLGMEHKRTGDYSNDETSDYYTIYIQPLADNQGYLELHELWLLVSGVDGYERHRFIFKAYLLDNEGNFVKELYSDMENYNRELKGE